MEKLKRKQTSFDAQPASRKALLFLGLGLIDFVEEALDRERYRSAMMRGGPEYASYIKKACQWKDYWETVKYLEKRKLASIKERAGGILVSLTETGLISSLIEQIRFAARHPRGLTTIVSFDFPKDARKARDRFREFLRECGFRRFHQSVWMSDRDVMKPLLKVMESHDADRWVIFFEVDLREGYFPRGIT